MTNAKKVISETTNIQAIDGLRGIAAMWVFVGHTMILTGWSIWPVGSPGTAVDLFIVLSGFVLGLRYAGSHMKYSKPQTRIWLFFWIKRFFRIAPLYYAVLMVTLLVEPLLFGARETIGHVVTTSITEADRYVDRSLPNIIAHVTFIFGAIPQFSYKTPLPDWSIGLEAQYYFVFPLIAMMFFRFGPLLTSFASTVICYSALLIAKDYLAAFPMPSALSIKLPIFLAGMLAARCKELEASRISIYAASAFAICFVPTWTTGGLAGGAARCLFVALLVGLPYANDAYKGTQIARYAVVLNRILSTRAIRWLGEISYDLYLVHLLVLLPIAAKVALVFGTGYPPLLRFAITLTVCSAIVLPISHLLHVTIERNGIRFGNRLLSANRPA